jgi:hypothetical protein
VAALSKTALSGRKPISGRISVLVQQQNVQPSVGLSRMREAYDVFSLPLIEVWLNKLIIVIIIMKIIRLSVDRMLSSDTHKKAMLHLAYTAKMGYTMCHEP